MAYAISWSLFVLAVGWVAGFQSGQHDAYREWDTANEVPTFTDSSEVPFDPLLIDDERSPEPEPPRNQTTRTESASNDRPQSTPQASDVERRTPGLNYLVLGSIEDREEADRLVRFLSAEGAPAQMVRVRVRGRTSWQVLTLQGITGREFGRNAAVRQEHESMVRSLGRRWLDEMKGNLDFTGPGRWQWTKYNP